MNANQKKVFSVYANILFSEETHMVKLIALLKRKPGISKEEFAQRWLTEHTKLSTKIPGVCGYRINIATDRQPADTGNEPIYDGTAEMWWDSIEAMEAAFATDQGKAAGADADQFADVRIHIYTEEHVIMPGPKKQVARRPATTNRNATGAR
jgi:uncharacterized protein (TIGR02118 family)